MKSLFTNSFSWRVFPIPGFLILLNLLSGVGNASARELTPADLSRYAECRELKERGNLRKAKELAAELVSDFAESPASSHKLAFTNELAILHQRLGFYQDARWGYEASLEIAAIVMSEPTVIARLKNNLAAILQLLGEFEEAERLCREALDLRIAVNGENSVETVPAMNNLAGLLWCIGDLEGAEEWYRKGLGIRTFAFGEDHPDTARLQANLAGLYFYKDRPTDALPLIERAVQTLSHEAGTQHPETLEALLFLGEIHRALGETETALAVYRKCREGRVACFGTAFHAKVAEAERRIGDSLRELGRYSESLQVYENSNRHYEEVLPSHHPDMIEGIFGAALASLGDGDEARTRLFARKLFGIEFGLLDSVLRFTDERQRLAYQRMFRSHHLFANLKAARELATFQLRRKGVVLDSLIQEARLIRRASDPQFASGFQRLFELRTAYRRDYLAGMDTEELRETERELQREYHNILSLLKKAADLSGQPDIEDLQARIRPGDVLIDYLRYDRYLGGARFESRYGAVVLSSDTAAFVDCVPSSQIDKAIQQLSGTLSNSGEINDEGVRTLMSSLFDAILSKPLSVVERAGALIICPEGPLNLVPFSALIEPSGRFLIEEYDVSYVTTSRSLLEEQRGASPGSGAVLMGNPDFNSPSSNHQTEEGQRDIFQNYDRSHLLHISNQLFPLEGAEREVRSIAEILEESGIRCHTFLGKSASERALRESVNRPYILHLATHGLFFPDLTGRRASSGRQNPFVPPGISEFQNPMFGSLLTLAGARGTFRDWANGRVPSLSNDGVLMANEAAELDLEGTLVVTLSACDTATGRVTSGDGVLGLRRGFKMAGAENVMTTLWPINDAVTVEIMHDFYAELIEGKTPESFSRVQRKWLLKIRDDSIQIPRGDGKTMTAGGLHWAINLAGPFLLSR